MCLYCRTMQFNQVLDHWQSYPESSLANVCRHFFVHLREPFGLCGLMLAGVAPTVENLVFCVAPNNPQCSGFQQALVERLRAYRDENDPRSVIMVSQIIVCLTGRAVPLI